MLSCFVLSETLIRTLAPPPGSPNARLPNAASTLNPLESALPKNSPITPLQSADPKTKDLKPFRIRRSEKRAGGGGRLLTSRSLHRHSRTPTRSARRSTSAACDSHARAVLLLGHFRSGDNR